jgi:RimJ/RimL family protein N-acetyltransferase
MPTAAANWPVPLPTLALRGEAVTLEPLAPEHEPELLNICQDEQIWRYLTSYGGTPEAMHEYLQAALRDYASGSALPFVIRAAGDRSNGSDGGDKSEAGEGRDAREGRVIGMTRLKNLSRGNRNAVVGSWLAPAAWGSGANTEAKLLLLTHAFETLECIRIEFHTDSRNLRSRAALKKIGAIEEGTLRSCHITREGSRRDTIVFSILDAEWPAVKERLLARLQSQMAKSTP